MREKAFENRLKRYLAEHQHYYVKFFANRMTRIGVPDILACVGGTFVGIEVKAENGVLSDIQAYNRREIFRSGGFSVVVYPKHYALFCRMIDALGSGNLDEARKVEFEINTTGRSHDFA